MDPEEFRQRLRVVPASHHVNPWTDFHLIIAQPYSRDAVPVFTDDDPDTVIVFHIYNRDLVHPALVPAEVEQALRHIFPTCRVGMKDGMQRPWIFVISGPDRIMFALLERFDG